MTERRFETLCRISLEYYFFWVILDFRNSLFICDASPKNNRVQGLIEFALSTRWLKVQKIEVLKMRQVANNSHRSKEILLLSKKKIWLARLTVFFVLALDHIKERLVNAWHTIPVDWFRISMSVLNKYMLIHFQWSVNLFVKGYLFR